MTVFRVWAPTAASVDLIVDDASVPMTASADGWFTVDAPMAGAGSDYGFSLDGSPPLPDPRSNWQPAGVHGLSRVVDHNGFPWTDGAWTGPGPLGSQLFSELHMGTFSPQGTFAGAAERIPHLRQLGVTAIEIMPVAQFPGTRGWGYDGVDLYAPHTAYGGPDGLKGLVDNAHGAGLAVFLDVVYNHLGPEGNYLSRYGPYFTDRYQTPWGASLNLDGADSGPVRDFLTDNALMWLRDYHIDGLRLDAVHAIFDTSALHVLEELAGRVRELSDQLGRHLYVVAESGLNDPRLVMPPAAGGYGLDAVWNDDFHHAVHALVTGERSGYYVDFGTLGDLAAAYQRGFVYTGQWSKHRRRRHGRRPEGVPGRSFVVYTQNHDQIGNRAGGERTSALIGTAGLKIAAALVLCSPFIPLLFQGEEWGASSPFLFFTDLPDELGRAVSEGRRREFASFGWDPEAVPDPQDGATFAASRLDWSELTRPPHAEVLDWYRRLVDLRRTVPAMTRGRLEKMRTDFDEAARWFVFGADGEFAVAVNLADRAQAVPLPNWPVTAIPQLVLASTAGAELDRRANRVELPPLSVAAIVVPAW